MKTIRKSLLDEKIYLCINGEIYLLHVELGRFFFGYERNYDSYKRIRDGNSEQTEK